MQLKVSEDTQVRKGHTVLVQSPVCALQEGNHHPCLHWSLAKHRRVLAGVYTSSLPAQAPMFPSSRNEVTGKMRCMCRTTGAEQMKHDAKQSWDAGFVKRWPGITEHWIQVTGCRLCLMEHCLLLLRPSRHLCSPQYGNGMLQPVLGHTSPCPYTGTTPVLFQTYCRDHLELFAAALGYTLISSTSLFHSHTVSRNEAQRSLMTTTTDSQCIITITCKQAITVGLRNMEHLQCQVDSVGCSYPWCTKEITTPEK